MITPVHEYEERVPSRFLALIKQKISKNSGILQRDVNLVTPPDCALAWFYQTSKSHMKCANMPSLSEFLRFTLTHKNKVKFVFVLKLIGLYPVFENHSKSNVIEIGWPINENKHKLTFLMPFTYTFWNVRSLESLFKNHSESAVSLSFQIFLWKLLRDAEISPWRSNEFS